MALKELRREDLSEEEIKELEKLYYQFQKKALLVFLGYLFTGFLATIVVVVIDALYIRDAGFMLLGCLGTGVVFLGGLRGSIDELSNTFVKDIQRFIKE